MTVPFDLNDLRFTGEALYRPECVLATARGSVYVSDWNGGVTWLKPGGGQERILAKNPEIDFKPNGFCLLENGDFLIANISDDGGIWRLQRDGGLTPYLLEADGARLPASNFVLLDDRGRIWITVSTRREPRSLGYKPDVDDGFIVLVDDGGARIVADGIGFTNEVVLSDDGKYLYVNETFVRRTSRFAVAEDGTLSDKQVVATYGAGTFPDGLTFDAEGALWATSIISNRLIRITPEGEQHILLEDADPAHLDWVEQAYQDQVMDRPHMDRIESKALRSVSSLCFGGPDLKTIWLGCLLGDQVAHLPSPVAGRPPAHWLFPW